MAFDFDKVIDRRGSNCLKYDFALERGKRQGILSFWVADMDFETAPAIVQRLQETVAGGIYGYTDTKEDYYQAIANWYENYFNWRPKSEWLIKTPGVVFALAAAVRAYTEVGDKVLIQQPVYYPFKEVIQDNGRELVSAPLSLLDGHYEIDFAELEEKLSDEKLKLFLLCSPHNPVGRVWKEEELRKIGDLCLKHHVIIVSDEIHGDFTYPGYTHHVFASLGKEYEQNSLICTAPSKTFNIAGLQVSNIFIPNDSLRRKFQLAVNQAGYSQLNMLGLAACQAAYEDGRAWLEELKTYLKANLDYLRQYLQENIPDVHLIEPEGTYLVWLDFRDLKLSEEKLEDLVVNKANLWLDSGAIFGKVGEGFERINIACPKSLLKEALDNLKTAVGELV